MNATEPLQAVIDDQAAQIATLQRQLEALAALLPKPVAGGIVRASDLGCRPNDAAFDNWPLLQPMLDRGLGIHFDARGLYSVSAPLRPKPGSAAPLLGCSASWRFNPECTTGLVPMKADQTHVVEINGAAPEGSGPIQIVRDLYFPNGPATNCDGIRVHGGYCVSIESCAFRRLRRGVHVEPTSGCYAPRVAACHFADCATGMSLVNGPTVCCFAAESCYVAGGVVGILIDGWRRGAAFTAVVAESQTSRGVWIKNGRASLRSCYFETALEGVPALELKQSHLTVEDSSVNLVKKDLASEITWIGQNVQGGTLAYGG